MPRFEPLSEEALATIERGLERLGAEVGVQFDHPRALELFRAAGQTVDDDTVSLRSGLLAAQAALAPPEFSLRARNPARDFVVGGDHMIFGPAQGPPFVRVDGERRDGTIADLEDLLRLTQLTDALDTPGRNILEPNDVPLDVAPPRARARGDPPDRPRVGRRALVRTRGRTTACAWPRSSSAAARRSSSEPVIFANCNVNSPLRFDVAHARGHRSPTPPPARP